MLANVPVDDPLPHLLQVNCETDFVAKNDQFQSLVSTVTHGLFSHQPTPAEVDQTTLSSTFLTAEELGKLETSDQVVLGDAVASAVGHLGEKLVLQRGCLLSSSKEGLLCGQAYNNLLPEGDIAVGKYAALLHLVPIRGPFEDCEAIEKLGCNLGQHIIGMNPEVVNEGDKNISDSSKVLTKQTFVLDDTVNIGDMLREHGAQVTGFVRYALGEH